MAAVVRFPSCCYVIVSMEGFPRICQKGCQIRADGEYDHFWKMSTVCPTATVEDGPKWKLAFRYLIQSVNSQAIFMKFFKPLPLDHFASIAFHYVACLYVSCGRFLKSFLVAQYNPLVRFYLVCRCDARHSGFRVNSDPNQLGPCYKQCPSWFTAVSDLVMVE